MSSANNSSYINDDDQNRIAFNSLFAFSSNARAAKPYSKRNLPDSFYRPPSVNSKNRNVHRQHTKSQSNVSEINAPLITNEPNYYHSRRVSDTAIGNESNSIDSRLAQINFHSPVLPLPDDWEAKITSDGQVYYIDHRTQCTTWEDPRPKHYAAFQTYCSTLPLPNGFEQTFDSKGNRYFIDHNNHQTYWEDPRPNFYRSLMTQRLDTSAIPSTTSTPSNDPLSSQLTEICKEKQVLQLRAQELEKMEADIRQKIDQRIQPTDEPMIDSTTLEYLIDDLFLHSRQNSTDSGLDDGRSSANPHNDGLNSSEIIDTILYSDSSNYPTLPLINDSLSKNHS